MTTELRQRQKGGASASARTASRPDAPSDDDSSLHIADPADNVPRVAPAHSAFHSNARGDGADAGPPASQLMDDGSDDDEDASSRAARALPDPSAPTNGSRLYLPASLRDVFEKRKAELLKQHPDVLERDLSNDLGPAPASSSELSLCPRLDTMIMLLFLGLLLWLLNTEYDIDLLAWAGKALKRALDPGPIQRGEEAPGDNAAGRQAMEAALKAARNKLKGH